MRRDERLVKAVARALCRLDHTDPDELAPDIYDNWLPRWRSYTRQAFAALEAAMPQWTASQWLIWSMDHQAFWGANRSGYTRHVDKAGRYSLEEASQICAIRTHRAWSELADDEPSELMLPAPPPADSSEPGAS